MLSDGINIWILLITGYIVQCGLHGILIFTPQTMAYLKDDMEEGHRTKTFSHLRWGREYCVSIKVESNAALSSSSVSPQQCVLLPEQGKKNIITRMHRLRDSGIDQRESYNLG